MKNNRKMNGGKILFVISVSLLLTMSVIISAGTTLGKYSKEIRLSPTWSVEIPGTGGSGDIVDPSGDDDGPGIFDEPHDTVYQVQPGDTLYTIAQKFHTTVEALAAYNGIDDPNMIHAGMILHIPPADYVAPATDAPEATDAPAATAAVDTPDTTAVPDVTPAPQE